MSVSHQDPNEDLDFLELTLKLWDGKLLIFTSILLSVLFGIGFNFSRDTLYKSNIVYSMDNIPPFYSEKKASTDFKKLFHSKLVFDEWRKDNEKTSISYEELSLTKVVKGIRIYKNQDERIASLQVTERGNYKRFDYSILVKTNKLDKLNDYFNYVNHLNNILRSRYILRAKKELNIIESRFKDMNSSQDTIILQLLSIDRYLVAADKGAKVLDIQHPTSPKKVSFGLAIILPICLIVGVFLGVFVVLLRNLYNNLKNKNQSLNR